MQPLNFFFESLHSQINVLNTQQQITSTINGINDDSYQELTRQFLKKSVKDAHSLFSILQHVVWTICSPIFLRPHTHTHTHTHTHSSSSGHLALFVLSYIHSNPAGRLLLLRLLLLLLLLPPGGPPPPPGGWSIVADPERKLPTRQPYS
jgi:hypothetical protein